LLTNELVKNYTGARAGDDFWVPADSVVLRTNITLRDIEVEPIFYTVESQVTSAKNATGLFETLYFQQIKIPSSCYLPWICLFTQYMNVGAAAPDWSISIWNATSDAYQLPYPGMEIPGSSAVFNPAQESFPISDIRYHMAHWENVSMPAVVLDQNNTYKHGGFYQFFVAVRMPTYLFNTGNQFWFYNNDTQTGGIDEGRAFARPWQFLSRETTELQGIDFTLITKIVPIEPTVAPETIDLRVNGELVTGTGDNTGRYDSDEQLRANEGRVQYSVMSAWSNMPGGITRFTLDITYVHGTQVLPRLQVTVPTGSTSAHWEAKFEIDFEQRPSFPVATLYLNVPLRWTNITFLNITGATPQSLPHEITLGPTTKYWSFLARDITPGKYAILCESSLVHSEVQLGLNPDGSIDLDDELPFNNTIIGASNGNLAFLRSDHEGIISRFKPTSGTANSDIITRLQVADGKGIQLSNTLIPSVADIISVFFRDLATNVGELNISSDFSLGIHPTEGFTASNIENIEFVIDYKIFNESMCIANLTSMNVPDNPTWNVDGLGAKDFFWRALLNDTSYVLVNLTYDGDGDHFSDIFFNFTCRVIEAGAEIDRARINELAFWFSMNFSSVITSQEIFMKNQSSGSFVQLQGVQFIQIGNQRPYIFWNSSEAPMILNLTHFIKPGQNTVELFVRSFNATHVDPTSTQVVGVNMAMNNFKYANTFNNFSLQFFNWSAGEFSNITSIVNQSIGDSTLTLSLNGTFPSIGDLFNASTNEIQVRFLAKSIVPFVNTASMWIDRIMIVVKYKGYERFWWEHSIVDAKGIRTFAMQNQTLFDAPANNFSSSIDVNAFIDFEKDYWFEAFWNNATDIAIWVKDFTVNKVLVSIHVSSASLDGAILENEFVSIAASLTHSFNGTGIAGKTIAFTFYIVSRNGLISELELFGTTDVSGSASVSIKASPSWRTFYVVVYFETDDVRLSRGESTPTQRVEVMTVFEYVIHMLVSNAVLILIVAALAVVCFVVKRRQDQKRRRGWMVDAGKLRDARKIRMLMVIHKASGGCILQRAYTQQNLDGDLISGFLTAIADFSKEIGPRGDKEQKENDAMYFDYQNFKILVANGNYCRGAIILDGEPTENLKNNLKYFINTFEQKYNLESWRGNVTMFSNADELVEAAFEISLLQALAAKKMTKQEAERSIPSGLGKALFQVASSISAEQGYFALSTLAIYAPTSKKISKDQVLAEIYRLKRRGFILPYRYYA